eukprot:13178535-Alexandrium_andersonii.AAC.1
MLSSRTRRRRSNLLQDTRDHLWQAAVRRRRVGPPRPGDRHQALQDLAGPPLSEGAACRSSVGAHF